MDLFDTGPSKRRGKPCVRWSGKPEDHPKFKTPDPKAGQTEPCAKCGSPKERTFFLRHSGQASAWGWFCRTCRKKNYKAWSQQPEVKAARPKMDPAYYKLYWTANRVRDQKLRRAYGITLEQFDEMLKAQGGLCAICKQAPLHSRAGKVLPLCVDHDHATGAVRGLLCTPCNVGIARFESLPGWAALATAYLAKA